MDPIVFVRRVQATKLELWSTSIPIYQSNEADVSVGRKLGTLQLKIELALVVWNFELLPTPPALSSFEEHDVLTGEPEQCYVRIAQVSR